MSHKLHILYTKYFQSNKVPSDESTPPNERSPEVTHDSTTDLSKKGQFLEDWLYVAAKSVETASTSLSFDLIFHLSWRNCSPESTPKGGSFGLIRALQWYIFQQCRGLNSDYLTCEARIRENQAGFRPSRECIDRIFLEQSHCFARATLVAFLVPKYAFGSLERR
ncbi:hypothetical protein CSKR_100025 [Clonorchis sinensis]|uniref:Uncharacterized protein n=1 Tax=Clonorchis sinensis TaxID=79923 RepID=A0A3R7CND2_CLOSI|nr:hypothetical protein CSKR_100025 [Clonorchis sinensis]